MAQKSKAEMLADLIEAHPNCQFDIDNDVWYMVDPNIKMAQEDEDDDEDKSEICKSDDYQWRTDWYSYSNLYGAGIAEALVILLNRRGFNIKASAV